MERNLIVGSRLYVRTGSYRTPYRIVHPYTARLYVSYTARTHEPYSPYLAQQIKSGWLGIVRTSLACMLAWTFRYPSRVTIGPLALLAFVDEFCADVLDFDIRDSAAAAGEHGLPTMRVIGRAGKGKRRFLVLGLDVKNLFDCETERDLAFDG